MQTTNNNVRRITLCAMLVALSVIIGTVCKTYLNITPVIRITFENFPIILTGMFFGPIAGGAVGMCSDLVTCLTSSQPSINPLITLGACAVGVTAGIIARVWRGDITLPRIIACVYGAHIVGTMTIKTIALNAYFQSPIILLRIPLYIVIAACECALIYLLTLNPQIRKYLDGLS